MTMQQEAMFASERPSTPRYLLTNRYNLLEILAARNAGSRGSFSKYYQDLLEIAPGRLPLLSAPFSQTLVEYVIAEEPMGAFPVALEFDPAVITNVPTSESLGDQAIAPAGTLPLDYMRAVHFRSQAELEEHAAREYENIRQPNALYMVSPELFVGNDDRATLEWLRGLDHVVDDAAEIKRLDRTSGALTLMATACPASDEAIETLRRVLDVKETRASKPHATWLVAAIRGGKGRRPSTDEQLMRSAMNVMQESDVSQSWRPVEVLETIWASVNPQIDATAREELESHIQRIREILRTERPFDRLRRGGIPSEKALLVALMRPDPARLVAIDPLEIGADWDVMLASAALVGALRGRRRMAVEFREPELDAYLALRESLAHNARVGSSLAIPKVAPLRLTSRSGGAGRVVRLGAASAVLLERTVIDKVERPRIELTDLSDPEVLSDLAEICVQLGWLDCTSVMVESAEPPQEVESASPTDTRIFRFSGNSVIRHVVDPTRLLTRLANDQSEGADRVRSRIRGGQGPSDSQRYSN